MSIRTDIRETLAADATLAAILTGGIYDASELPEDGLTPSGVPGAFDAVGRLSPVAVVRFSTMTETELIGASKRRFFQIWIYDDVGYANIDTAQARCRVLLHRRKRFKTDGGTVYYTTWVDDTDEMRAEELGGKPMGMSRYYFDYVEA